MTDDSSSSVVVPDDLRAQHPDLVDLILRSESMNDEERQYWVNILPIMTPEQVQNLRDILSNERTQLAAIDAKYAKTANTPTDPARASAIEEERKRRSSERKQAEEHAKKTEEQSTDALLNKIDTF